MGRDVHSWDMGKSCSGEWGMVESNKGQTTLAGLEALGGRTFSKSGGARTGSQAGAQHGLVYSSLASSMALGNVLLLFFFSSVPGLRVLELLSVKDEADLAHTAAGWRNVTQRRGFRLRSARDDPKGEGRASAPQSREPEALARRRASDRPGSAQAQVGEAARGRISAARGCPLVAARRHGTAASTQRRGAGRRLRVQTGQPGRPAKRCVFPGPRGPGEPCVFAWWEWFTGKVDGRYPANRHALYCLGVNSLESKYQPLWNVFPLVRGLKISHKKHHSALAEVLAGYSIIPLLCPKKAPEIFPCDPVTLHLYRLSKHLMTVEEEVGDRTWIWKAHSMDLGMGLRLEKRCSLTHWVIK
ncbi:uncharacterized protein LOC115898997 [Rhinopithecus roxellana]|uniref:uncharacterized protein LOC115898997 n=1 Tax=Rhinopithecus roxellana TaxID=61622 RepID=UPI00123774A9|nr:uncharacterized protein LOC115898997 [Rhinopithecus roxellana]